MNVLFVSSGKMINKVSPIILNQAESIMKYDNTISVDKFIINGNGIVNYLKAVEELKLITQEKKYDLIHSHYAFSGYVVALSRLKIPKIVSFMGSDAFMRFPFSILNTILIKKYWNYIIVKSENLVPFLKLKNKFKIIPNGININKFFHFEKNEARKKLNLCIDRKYVLFASNPARHEKNFKLAKKVFDLLNLKDIELLIVYNKPNDIMPYYYNAVDLLLLTSYREGSPNVIKEAMACNCPIVSTDVGDVKYVVGKTKNCYVGSFDMKELVGETKNILYRRDRSNGRERIINLGLDSDSIAKQIIDIYKMIIPKKHE